MQMRDVVGIFFLGGRADDGTGAADRFTARPFRHTPWNFFRPRTETAERMPVILVQILLVKTKFK